MKKRSSILLSAATLLGLLAGVTAQAANVTWIGAALDGLYSNTNNWDTLSLPTAVDNVYMQNGDTISYADGVTNTVDRAFISGGTVVNMTGGFWNHDLPGNTIRTFVGTGGTSGTVNQSGGMCRIGHALWITEGSEYNLTGGQLEVYRGSNTGVGGGIPNGASISVGRTANAGLFKVSGGSVGTRGPIEIGAMGTVEIVGGYADSINLGVQAFGNGDGGWYQVAGATLKIGISTNGLTPIVLNDTGATGTPVAQLFADSVLDVSFIDGALETNLWPVIVNTNGTMSNLGMVFAAGVDTNNWGFITSNNTLWVGYGLGWPAGGDVLAPPEPGRDLYWTGAGGDTASDNPTNWVVDLIGTPATWGPYQNDLWNIANTSVPGVSNGTNYIVDYEGTASFVSQTHLQIGNGGIGTLNYNSGTLNFTASASSQQSFGVNGGQGTLNVNAGALDLNAARLGLGGGSDAQGWINIYGGTLTIARGYADASMWIGLDSGCTGTVYIVGGRMFTRTKVHLGNASGGVGTFHVEGSASTDIGIGSSGTLDGEWEQYAGSTIKFEIDAGGITPIFINDKGSTDQYSGDVIFHDGSLLDVGFTTGFAGENGSWDVMHWLGDLVESNLAFAAGVDTNVWSWDFVDTDADTTNDTLRVTATGFAPNVVPNITAYSYNGTTVNLSWDSETGFDYNVLSKSTLTDPTWTTNVAAIPGAGATTSTTNVVPSGGTEEFFRIEVY
jgi:hypothetical protein